MQPQDPNNQQQMRPSDPPPSQLPRPRIRMTDIRPATSSQQPPRPLQPHEPQTTQASSPHINDHLLAPPHEPRLTAGQQADLSDAGISLGSEKKKRSKLAWLMWIFAFFVVVLIAALAGAVWWYQQQLTPVQQNSNEQVRLTIEQGSSPSMIGTQLKENSLIRSTLAFSVYTKLSKTENTLKAGVYNLSPGESTQQIVDHLVSGKQDTFSLTFLPGDTLASSRKRLLQVGYSEAEIDAALQKTYSQSLFSGKPASADLEGYIYGNTFTFDTSATVEDVLNHTFDEFEKGIEKNNITSGLKAQGLTLYQGIILASIVQREVTNKNPDMPTEDQREVAGVFYNRMKVGMNLGSDVTYQYAARKMGVDPTPLLESPYNTRKYTGLPPGPIATPGLGALMAVANPAKHDYLFFLSGDDDITYFAKTDAGHQKNIEDHCKQKCLIN